MLNEVPSLVGCFRLFNIEILSFLDGICYFRRCRINVGIAMLLVNVTV